MLLPKCPPLVAVPADEDALKGGLPLARGHRVHEGGATLLPVVGVRHALAIAHLRIRKSDGLGLN